MSDDEPGVRPRRGKAKVTLEEEGSEMSDFSVSEESGSESESMSSRRKSGKGGKSVTQEKIAPNMIPPQVTEYLEPLDIEEPLLIRDPAKSYVEIEKLYPDFQTNRPIPVLCRVTNRVFVVPAYYFLQHYINVEEELEKFDTSYTCPLPKPVWYATSNLNDLYAKHGYRLPGDTSTYVATMKQMGRKVVSNPKYPTEEGEPELIEIDIEEDILSSYPQLPDAPQWLLNIDLDVYNNRQLVAHEMTSGSLRKHKRALIEQTRFTVDSTQFPPGLGLESVGGHTEFQHKLKEVLKQYVTVDAQRHVLFDSNSSMRQMFPTAATGVTKDDVLTLPSWNLHGYDAASIPVAEVVFTPTHRMGPIWHYPSLGMQPFSLRTYQALYSHPDWSLYETIALLDLVDSRGLGCWERARADNILSVRQTPETCMTRFEQLQALTSLFSRDAGRAFLIGIGSGDRNWDVPVTLPPIHPGTLGADGFYSQAIAREREKEGEELYLQTAVYQEEETQAVATRGGRSARVKAEVVQPIVEEPTAARRVKTQRLHTYAEDGDDEDEEDDFLSDEETVEEIEPAFKMDKLLGMKNVKKRVVLKCYGSFVDHKWLEAIEQSDDVKGELSRREEASYDAYITEIRDCMLDILEYGDDYYYNGMHRDLALSIGKRSYEDEDEEDLPMEEEENMMLDAEVDNMMKLEIKAEPTSSNTHENTTMTDNENPADMKLEATKVDVPQEEETSYGHRMRQMQNSAIQPIEVQMYLVKDLGKSYQLAKWYTMSQLIRRYGLRSATDRVKRYLGKKSEIDAHNLDRYGGAHFDPKFLEVDRVLSIIYAITTLADLQQDERTPESVNAVPIPANTPFSLDSETLSITLLDPVTNSDSWKAPSADVQAPASFIRYYVLHAYVKWQGQAYSQATWEYLKDVKNEMRISQYKRFSRLPLQSQLEKKVFTVEQENQRAARRSRWYMQSPVYKSNNTLRDYQTFGVNWLIDTYMSNKNGILADEMGLGKTVQCVAFLEHLRREEGLRGPFLIVAPLSTLTHWKRESEGWTDMNCIVYHDPANGQLGRQVIRENEFYFPGTNIVKFNMMITSYEMLLSDCQELAILPWRYVIVDEGHKLKNKTAKLLQAFDMLQIPRRLLLTGTPIQNNTTELWTLLNFVDARAFPSLQAFLTTYGELSHSEQVEKLQRAIAPYILRRMKETVAKSLPPKEETVIDVELTTLQKKYYRAIYERNQKFLRQGMSSNNAPKLLNIEAELRKCCNHPWLVAGTEEKEVPAGATEQAFYELTIQASGKLVLLDKLLPKLFKDGHKVLIFSQMVMLLDILADYMRFRKYKFERLDGSVTGDEREAAIDRFCRPESDRFVFLLSTRAGGVGLNLTSADTVIIFDSDWNPQMDVQAQARAHRLGQKNAVSVYRLVTRNTYESEMFSRASRKLGLEQAVMRKLEMGGDEKVDSKEDIDKLLKLGAYGLLDDDDDEQRKRFFDGDIDSILINNTHVISDAKNEEGGEDKKRAQIGGLVYTKTYFSAEDQNQAVLDVNDTEFWSRVLGDNDFKYSPSSLLSRLTDASATRTEQTRAKFWEDLIECMKRIRERKEKNGDENDLEVEECVGLQLQFTGMSQFSDEQRAEVEVWMKEIDNRANRRRQAVVDPHAAFSFDDYTPKKKKGRLVASTGRRGRPPKSAYVFDEDDDDDNNDDDDDDEVEDEEDDDYPPLKLYGSAQQEARGGTQRAVRGRGGRGRRNRSGDRSYNFTNPGGRGDYDASSLGLPKRGRGARPQFTNVVCSECLAPGELIGCDGPCARVFHPECVPKGPPKEGTCKPGPLGQWGCVSAPPPGIATSVDEANFRRAALRQEANVGEDTHLFLRTIVDDGRDYMPYDGAVLPDFEKPKETWLCAECACNSWRCGGCGYVANVYQRDDPKMDEEGGDGEEEEVDDDEEEIVEGTTYEQLQDGSYNTIHTAADGVRTIITVLPNGTQTQRVEAKVSAKKKKPRKKYRRAQRSALEEVLCRVPYVPEQGDRYIAGKQACAVRFCSVASCGHAAHVDCARKEGNCQFYGKGESLTAFRCGLHFCAVCNNKLHGKMTGDGTNLNTWAEKSKENDNDEKDGKKEDDDEKRDIFVLSCATCTNAYHANCMPAEAIRLSKKVVFCPSCAHKAKACEEGRKVIKHAQMPYTYKMLRDRLKGRKKKPMMGFDDKEDRGKSRKRKNEEEDGALAATPVQPKKSKAKKSASGSQAAQLDIMQQMHMNPLNMSDPAMLMQMQMHMQMQAQQHMPK